MRLWQKRRESRKALEKRVELLEQIARMRVSFGVLGEAPWIEADAESLFLSHVYAYKPGEPMRETLQIAANVWLKFEVKNS